MSQHLAIQLNGTKARLLLASAEKNVVRVRHATEVTSEDAHGLPAKIRDVVNEWSCAGAKTLVALDREQCEIRRLEVPDVADDDLPDLARYQALQNFSALGPEWPLDFIKLPKTDESDEGNHVLAGAISPDRMKAIEDTCETIGCPLEGIILRPCATAAVIDTVMPAPRGEGQVVVDQHQGVADIFVTVGPKTILMRSVRLPSDEAAATKALLPEIRRTIAAASSTLPGLKVSRIAVCGSSRVDADIASGLRSDAGLPVVNVEDWAGAKIHKSLDAEPPQNPGRFLPLIGLVRAEMAAQDSVIDFRRPRQRPPAPDNSRTYKLLALLAAVVLGVIFFGIRSMLKNEDKTIAFKQTQTRQNEEPVKEAEKLMAAFFQMENWHANSPNWLDELNELTKRLPAAEQVRLNEIVFNDRDAMSLRMTDTTDRGAIILKGFLDNNTSTLTSMHDALQDERHRVQSGARVNKPGDSDYPCRFGDTIYVTTGLDVAPNASSSADTEEVADQTPVKETPHNDDTAEPDEETVIPEAAAESTVEEESQDETENKKEDEGSASEDQS